MANKSNGMDVWYRAPPPKRSLLENVARAIYNPDDSSFLGRTAKRWGVVLVFYAVFYAVLAVMFALCMAGLFATLDDKRPKFTLESSLIGSNPGVASRPLPTNGMNVEYATDNITDLVKNLQTFLNPYIGQPWVKPNKCVSEANYGYPENPCFYIKLNKVFDWEPKYYEDISTLPEEASAELKEYITALQPHEKKQVWVECYWETKNINATFEYPWGMGLPGQYYPYTNQADYVSPIVAVKILNVPVNKEVVFRCRALAENIRFNKSIKEFSGYTRIILNVKDDTKKE